MYIQLHSLWHVCRTAQLKHRGREQDITSTHKKHTHTPDSGSVTVPGGLLGHSTERQGLEHQRAGTVEEVEGEMDSSLAPVTALSLGIDLRRTV